MIITLEEAKKYLRLEPDFTEEDDLIGGLVAAAETYIKNATGNTFDGTNELAKLAVKLLVVHWYENREPAGSAQKLAFSLEVMLTQLKYCYSSTEGGGTA